MKCPICNFNLNKLQKSYLPHCYICVNCTGHFIGKAKKATYPESYFDEGKRLPLVSDLLEIPLNLFLGLRVLSISKIAKSKKAKILDYGCGSGKLVDKLLSQKYQAIGFEPSAGALKITKRLRIPVYKNVKSTNGGYNLIMFWHSLEHTDSPLDVIKKVTRFVSPKGKLLIAVPNANSFNAKIGGEKWFHYTYPLHKVHFTPLAINIMLKKAGWKIENMDFFNPEYTLSGLIQTYLNFFFPKDVLYSLIAHRRSSMSQSKVFFYSVLSLLLLVITSPIIFTIYFVELLFKKTDAIVITACRLTK